MELLSEQPQAAAESRERLSSRGLTVPVVLSIVGSLLAFVAIAVGLFYATDRAAESEALHEAALIDVDQVGHGGAPQDIEVGNVEPAIAEFAKSAENCTRKAFAMAERATDPRGLSSAMSAARNGGANDAI